MKNIITVIIIILCSMQTFAQPPDLLPGETWIKYFEDEFNDPIETNANWIVYDEKDNYDEDNPDNVYIAIDDNVYTETGKLIIKADVGPYTCETDPSPWTHHFMTYDYTTGLIETYYKFIHYGYIEARVKCPYYDTFNSAFWTLISDNHFNGPFVNASEIDIFENCGWNTWRKTSTNVHLNYEEDENGNPLDPDRGEQYWVGTNYWDSDYCEYHVYGCHWEYGTIKFYVDGNLKRTMINPGVHDPIRLIFDIFFGRPGENTNFPYYMYIDWIRLWGKEKTVENFIVPNEFDDYASWSYTAGGNGGTYEVTGTGKHLLYATRKVTLKPGFIASEGCEFKARVDLEWTPKEPVDNAYYSGYNKTDSEEEQIRDKQIALSYDESISKYTEKDKQSTFDNQDEEYSFGIYPNPANSFVNVSSFGLISKVELKDSKGRTVKTINNINSNFTEINLNDLFTGIYIMHIESVDGIVITKKVIKK